MTWTLIWFVVNIFFVVSVVTYMFIHRSYTEARRQSNDAALVRRLNAMRMLVGILSIVLFVAMSASFMVNMRLNG
ncbi:hypothetical protein [Paenibacillus sinopodophylli]|uniref:hypothetical protein n=1 Tax=Paenibacillus sinopodophylli TaxID=1837342 RepID=UPI00110CB8F2|nr:hypothetical protein [Paenibacillus sinopodophylli]